MSFRPGDGNAPTLAKQREPLALVWSRPLPERAKPTSVTVSKDKIGRYFVSILIEEDITPLAPTEKTVGIDLGLTSFLVTSDGETIANPKYYAGDEKKLAKAQRKHARKKKGSKNHRLAKAIADIGWGGFTRQLKYKAKWYGRTIIKIDRWYPSSKTCSLCQHALEELTLDMREWVCPQCGACHDRDRNAAHNILTEGLSARQESSQGCCILGKPF